MRKLIVAISKLKYLGLLGLPMIVSDMHIWKYFWLFWLFGVLEIMFIFPVFIQSLQQAAGLIYIALKYKELPDPDYYQPQVLYSLPFEAEWTVVNGGVYKEDSHSWAIATQRYAYDFIILDLQGRSFAGSEAACADYYCYEKNILSPADGVVVEVKNSCRDSQVMGGGQTDPLIKDIRGNYVVIQHSSNEYSCLTHLKLNSILVEVGQTVKRKQPIARCGNTGNSSEPHLHFQVQNGKSFFTSAGLPIHFQNIQAALQPEYSLYDKRTINLERKERPNFISRGQRVRND